MSGHDGEVICKFEGGGATPVCECGWEGTENCEVVDAYVELVNHQQEMKETP